MIASIDPGSSAMGLALWNPDDWKVRLAHPEFIVNIYPGNHADSHDKILEILWYLDNKFKEFKVTEVVSETCEYFDTAGGATVAKEGALVKLARSVGAVEGLCHSMKIPLTLVLPREWKGQTSKEMVDRKVRTILPNLPSHAKSHNIDAIGIGLWAQGFYKR